MFRLILISKVQEEICHGSKTCNSPGRKCFRTMTEPGDLVVASLMTIVLLVTEREYLHIRKPELGKGSSCWRSWRDLATLTSV